MSATDRQEYRCEASQRLSDQIKTTRPEIEWEQISGFRNVLVHNYLGIDLESVWTIIGRDTPALKAAVEEMLSTARTVQE